MARRGSPARSTSLSLPEFEDESVVSEAHGVGDTFRVLAAIGATATR